MTSWSSRRQPRGRETIRHLEERKAQPHTHSGARIAWHMNGAQDHLQPIWSVLGMIASEELLSVDPSPHTTHSGERQRS